MLLRLVDLPAANKLDWLACLEAAVEEGAREPNATLELGFLRLLLLPLVLLRPVAVSGLLDGRLLGPSIFELNLSPR